MKHLYNIGWWYKASRFSLSFIIYSAILGKNLPATCLIMFIHDVSQTAPENPPPTHFSPQKDTYYSTADKVASSRCSVSWGAARKTAREKIKRTTARPRFFIFFRGEPQLYLEWTLGRGYRWSYSSIILEANQNNDRVDIGLKTEIRLTAGCDWQFRLGYCNLTLPWWCTPPGFYHLPRFT